MSAVFVTGAGTDIGKTFVSCALLRRLRALGVTVDALKPVVSGFDDDDPGGSDSAQLLAALGASATPEALARVSPWRFRAPLSPHLAAAREGRAIDVDAVVTTCRQAADRMRGGILVIEGVGGVHVPLDDRHTIADVIDRLDLPVVLVCGTYLGAISHALTALEVLRARGRAIAAVAVSASADPALSLDEMLRTLAHHAPGIEAVGITRGAGSNDEAFAALARRIERAVALA